MGLAGNKNRTKLSHDPNNTAWARDTKTFGRKILAKQGWKEGDYLGAENASHASHYTAANASHIRVMLREDNLGLGAKIGGGNAETFGLSMFSGLLGRLNGKDEATLKKQEDSIRDAELRMYGDRKFGFMNFVSGGLLVGDKMEPPKSTRIEDIKPQVVAVKAETEKKSKKRKADDGETEGEETSKKKLKSEKSSANKEKKSKSKVKAPSEDFPASDAPVQKVEDSSSSDSSEEDQAKTEKRQRKAQRKAEKEPKRAKSKASDDEKSRLKEEKRARKDERHKRKEEKRKKRAEKEASSAKTSVPTSAINSEAERSGTSTPTFMGGRQALRQRYIMQKRMASGNAAALKEIFMLQPQAAS
ncbi:Protein PXR1 [Pseudocercospora fuligena]|uniref:Protein PXR1 n=1 Tax=Pseudocercospora fuligena TaxID=685502 RepID=A0A8H6VCD5_9PEZI|nr:Protein PXR1 [Pseudocercospora fuligena]